MSRPDPSDFVCYRQVRSDRTDERLMTVIGGTPFYCSTGENSGAPGTWFPFMCIEPNGHIGKAYATAMGGDIYREDLSDILFGEGFKETDLYRQLPDALFSGFFSRFDSFQSLVTSADIGGGFWKAEHVESYFYPVDKEAVQNLISALLVFIQEKARAENLTTDSAVERVKVLVSMDKSDAIDFRRHIPVYDVSGEKIPDKEINRFLIDKGAKKEVVDYIVMIHQMAADRAVGKLFKEAVTLRKAGAAGETPKASEEPLVIPREFFEHMKRDFVTELKKICDSVDQKNAAMPSLFKAVSDETAVVQAINQRIAASQSIGELQGVIQDAFGVLKADYHACLLKFTADCLSLKDAQLTDKAPRAS